MWLAWLIAVLLLLQAAKVESVTGSPKCFQYQPQLEDGSIGFCAGIVNYAYYRQSLQSQRSMELEAFQKLTRGWYKL